MILTGVMVLAMAGFLLVMGLIMMDTLQVDTADTTATVRNETLTSVDSDGEVVTNSGACGFNKFTILHMTNATDGYVIDSLNYSLTDREGRVSATADVDTSIDGTNWNVSYTYDYGANAACTAANSTIEGQGKMGDYFDLIVLAIIISVIVSLIIIGFAGRQTQ